MQTVQHFRAHRCNTYKPFCAPNKKLRANLLTVQHFRAPRCSPYKPFCALAIDVQKLVGGNIKRVIGHIHPLNVSSMYSCSNPGNGVSNFRSRQYEKRASSDFRRWGPPSTAKCLLLHDRAPEKSENFGVLQYVIASRAPTCPPKGSQQGV